MLDGHDSKLSQHLFRVTGNCWTQERAGECVPRVTGAPFRFREPGLEARSFEPRRCTEWLAPCLPHTRTLLLVHGALKPRIQGRHQKLQIQGRRDAGLQHVSAASTSMPRALPRSAACPSCCTCLTRAPPLGAGTMARLRGAGRRDAAQRIRSADAPFTGGSVKGPGKLKAKRLGPAAAVQERL